jgi:hypothetical protein
VILKPPVVGPVKTEVVPVTFVGALVALELNVKVLVPAVKDAKLHVLEDPDDIV